MQDDHCGSRTEEHAYTAGIIVNIYIHSACQWRLNFLRCNITKTWIRMLSGTTGGSLNHVESIDLSFNPVNTGGVYFGESNAVCFLFYAVSKSGWVAD